MEAGTQTEDIEMLDLVKDNHTDISDYFSMSRQTQNIRQKIRHIILQLHHFRRPVCLPGVSR